MPTPYLIDDAIDRVGLPLGPLAGPFAYNGALYVALNDLDNSVVLPDGTLGIFKSTNNGQTWSALDRANAPVFLQGSGAATRSGTSIWMTYLTYPSVGIVGTVNLIEFDLVTETYGGPISGGPTYSDASNGPFRSTMTVDVSTSGEKFIFYGELNADGFGVACVSYNGSWGSKQTIATGIVDDIAYRIMASLADDAGSAWCLYVNSRLTALDSNTFCASFDGSSVGGPYTILSADVFNALSPDSVYGQGVYDAGKLLFPISVRGIAVSYTPPIPNDMFVVEIPITNPTSPVFHGVANHTVTDDYGFPFMFTDGTRLKFFVEKALGVEPFSYQYAYFDALLSDLSAWSAEAIYWDSDIDPFPAPFSILEFSPSYGAFIPGGIGITIGGFNFFCAVQFFLGQFSVRRVFSQYIHRSNAPGQA